MLLPLTRAAARSETVDKQRVSRMEWVTLPGSRIGILRRFGVYLPPGYDQDLGREYPVLYLLRGHEAEWAGSAKLLRLRCSCSNDFII